MIGHCPHFGTLGKNGLAAVMSLEYYCPDTYTHTTPIGCSTCSTKIEPRQKNDLLGGLGCRCQEERVVEVEMVCTTAPLRPCVWDLLLIIVRLLHSRSSSCRRTRLVSQSRSAARAQSLGTASPTPAGLGPTPPGSRLICPVLICIRPTLCRSSMRYYRPLSSSPIPFTDHVRLMSKGLVLDCAFHSLLFGSITVKIRTSHITDIKII